MDQRAPDGQLPLGLAESDRMNTQDTAWRRWSFVECVQHKQPARAATLPRRIRRAGRSTVTPTPRAGLQAQRLGELHWAVRGTRSAVPFGWNLTQTRESPETSSHRHPFAPMRRPSSLLARNASSMKAAASWPRDVATDGDEDRRRAPRTERRSAPSCFFALRAWQAPNDRRRRVSARGQAGRCGRRAGSGAIDRSINRSVGRISGPPFGAASPPGARGRCPPPSHPGSSAGRPARATAPSRPRRARRTCDPTRKTVKPSGHPTSPDRVRGLAAVGVMRSLAANTAERERLEKC